MRGYKLRHCVLKKVRTVIGQFEVCLTQRRKIPKEKRKENPGSLCCLYVLA